MRMRGRSSLTIVSQVPHNRFRIPPILSSIEPAADLTSAQSVHLFFLPTAICDRRILSLDHKDLLSRKSRPANVFRSTTRSLELRNRVRLAPRDLQTCHCHDNARSRCRQHRDSTHEGRGVSRGIPRTIETTPRNSEIPARFAPAYDSETPLSKQWARQFLIWFIKRLFLRALSIDCCFVFYLVPIYICNISPHLRVDILLILEKIRKEKKRERAAAYVSLYLHAKYLSRYFISNFY